VNTGDWAQANLGAGGNWQTANLSAQLFAGANTISAYALDAAGNISLTNTIAFSYTLQQQGTDWAPDSLNGLLALVSPDNGGMVGVSFDPATFAQVSAANSQDPKDYGGGTYTYLKTDTNAAQLTLAFNAPPGNSNSLGPISLVFTNQSVGYFTNGTDTGIINLRAANAFVPSTLVGKTLTALSANNGKTTKIKLTTATAFTKTPANNSSSGSSSGTYVYTRLSPMCAALNATFTSAADAGQTAWLQLTFATANTGLYYVAVFDNQGVLQDIDIGTFSM